MTKIVKKTMVASALMFVLVAASVVTPAAAQDSNAGAKSATQELPKPLEAYRLDFSISELDDGKKINTRQYSMYIDANDSNELKIGTRVPIETPAGVENMDVGTNISSRLQARNGQLELHVSTEMSNFAIPEQAQGHARPVIRQLKISATTLALLGKPMVIGSVDDPNSKRQFQVEVTVTKLR
jgi:hypothetical protein